MPILAPGSIAAWSLACYAAFRNIGLVMATLGSTLLDIAWFFFAMVQFPIYLLPVVVQLLGRRFVKKR